MTFLMTFDENGEINHISTILDQKRKTLGLILAKKMKSLQFTIMMVIHVARLTIHEAGVSIPLIFFDKLVKPAKNWKQVRGLNAFYESGKSSF